MTADANGLEHTNRNNPSAAYGVSSLYTREPYDSFRYTYKKAVYKCYVDRSWHPQQEFAAPCKASHGEAARQCGEPNSAGSGVFKHCANK